MAGICDGSPKVQHGWALGPALGPALHARIVGHKTLAEGHGRRELGRTEERGSRSPAKEARRRRTGVVVGAGGGPVPAWQGAGGGNACAEAVGKGGGALERAAPSKSAKQGGPAAASCRGWPGRASWTAARYTWPGEAGIARAHRRCSLTPVVAHQVQVPVVRHHLRAGAARWEGRHRLRQAGEGGGGGGRGAPAEPGSTEAQHSYQAASQVLYTAACPPGGLPRPRPHSPWSSFP